MPLISLKLGALALVSTIGTIMHQYSGAPASEWVEPSGAAPAGASLFECAVKHGGCGHKTSQAKEWLEGLQQKDVNKALNEILDTNSPLHQMLRTIDNGSLSDFEDCAALRPGIASTLLAQKSIKKSTYRSFLRSSMSCAGEAFKASGAPWPTAGMAMDTLEMMSVDWLTSSMLTMELAGKYKPLISSLPNNGNKLFQECMAGIKDHPGSPGASPKAAKSPRRRTDGQGPEFSDVVADISGVQEVAKPPARSGQPEGPSSQKGGPNRRLMKGFFFFFFFGDGADYGGACFADEGTVVDARTQSTKMIGDVTIGDELVTTVPDDKVWFMHTGGVTKLIRLRTTEAAIDLTPTHIISTSTGMKQASTIQVGDLLVKETGEYTEVVALESAADASVSAPITMSGTIVVNGVVASCYAYGTHDIIHAALAPFRALYYISPQLSMLVAQPGLALMTVATQMLPIAEYLDTLLVSCVVASLSVPLTAAYFTGSKMMRKPAKA